MSYKTIKKRFDNDSYTTGEITTLSRAINIIFDATYFEKKEGLLLFRSEGKNIYWRKIQSESKREIES